MAVPKEGWEKLAELWDLSGLAGVVSRTLASLYMVEAGLLGRGVDIEGLARDIRKCKRILEKLLEDLESCARWGSGD